MADVVLVGPEREWLDAAEVQAALRVTEGQLVELIRSGLFPAGHRAAAKSPPMWRNADVASYLWLTGRGCRLQASQRKTEKSEKLDEEEFL